MTRYLVAYVVLMAGLIGVMSLETAAYVLFAGAAVGVLWPRQRKPMARRR